MKKMEKTVDDALLHAGKYLEWRLKEKIAEKAHDEGGLWASVIARSSGRGKVEVWSDLEYAYVIEHGRKPWKYPNFDALVWWTARKWMHHGGKTAKYDDLHYKDKWIVFIIARKIMRDGTEPKHIFKKVKKREERNIISVFKKHLKND